MMDPSETYSKLINHIKNEKEVEESLLSLKLLLSHLSLTQISEIIRDDHIGVLFDCLNSSNANQIQLTCEVLKMVMCCVPTTKLYTQYRKALLRALAHPMNEVRIAILQEIRRTIADSSLTTAMEEDNELLHSIGKCLCDENSSVGNLSMEILKELVKSKNGHIFIKLCIPKFFDQIMKFCENEKNKEIVVRNYDVLFTFCVASSDALHYLDEKGLSKRIHYFIDDNDVLAKLALINAFSELSQTHHGWNFLVKQNVIKKLIKPLADYQQDDFMRFIYPEIAKFFGKIEISNPGLVRSSFPEVFDYFYRALDQGVTSNILLSTLNVISSIAYTWQGKSQLIHDGENMRRVMERLHDLMNANLLPCTRTMVLYTVSKIIHLEESDSSFAEAMEINEIWFNYLGSSALQEILSMAKQPFEDLKIGAMTVFLNMANQKWGQIKFHTSGILDFLLDRKSEKGQKGLLLKYDILKTIASSKTAENIFNSIEFSAILVYVQQGPFFSPPTTEVAVEDAV